MTKVSETEAARVYLETVRDCPAGPLSDPRRKVQQRLKEVGWTVREFNDWLASVNKEEYKEYQRLAAQIIMN